jgi:hypothetical protein
MKDCGTPIILSLLVGYSRRKPYLQDLGDMFIVYGALAMLHMAIGDDTAAQRFLASLEPLVETEDDERRFTQARELVKRAMPKGMFGSILRRLATSSPQPYKRRR